MKMRAGARGLAGLAALLGVAGQAGTAVADDARASARVKQVVTVELAISSGDVRVKAGRAGEVVLQADDDSRPTLTVRGNRVVAEVESMNSDVTIRVPRGSHIEVNTISGDIAVEGVGHVDLRTTTGDIAVDGAASLSARAIKGDVTANAVAGEIRVKTVSGSANIDGRSAGANARLEFETTSGDLKWSGECGRDCRLRAASLSGDIQLKLARSSSFEVRFSAYSGSLKDGIGLTRQQGHRERARRNGRYDRGDGRIEVETYSGDLQLSFDR